jgi:polar amino acid transport system substrate-binding protein
MKIMDNQNTRDLGSAAAPELLPEIEAESKSVNTKRGLPFVDVRTATDSIRMLTQGDAQAVIYDAPALQYWAAKRGKGVLAVVGPNLQAGKYGIAVANDNTLRTGINEALL